MKTIEKVVGASSILMGFAVITVGAITHQHVFIIGGYWFLVILVLHLIFTYN